MGGVIGGVPPIETLKIVPFNKYSTRDKDLVLLEEKTELPVKGSDEQEGTRSISRERQG